MICDDNRVNQKCFKKFLTVPGKPWLTQDGMFLFFDYVHLLKNIRNNWITEKCSELKFYDNGIEMVAKWEILKSLYKREKDEIIKLSKLTEVSVYPKPIERQKVSHCLKFFCDETIAALKTTTYLPIDETNETVIFLEKILKFWKIVSTKEIYGDLRKKDPLRKTVSDVQDENLQYLRDFAKLSKSMRGKQGKRIKSLTKDTSEAIEHTCYGLVEMCEHLLESGFDFVMLGEFTSDFLEKCD